MTRHDPRHGPRSSWWALVAGIVLLASASCASPPDKPPTGPPWFEEVARERGLRFEHRSGHAERHIFPEIIGGGAALFDMDGDGDLDAYLVQSGNLIDPGAQGGVNRLFENDGAGHFRDVTEGSGADDDGYGMGVAAGDYDDDGDVDLYVTNYGPNVLLRNEGGGRFADVTVAAGVGHRGWGTSAAFVDYDADGDLDLFFTNYVNWSLTDERDCYNTAWQLDYCLPTNYKSPATDVLYRNDGVGRFTDVTVESNLNTSFGNGLGVVCADYDGDGAIDIFVANDAMLNQLWLNRQDGTFVDESLLRGCALDEHGMTKSGMGVAAEDYDDDGDPDLIVVNLETQTDSFFLNEDGFFRDHTGEVGLGATSRVHTRFGIGLVDFDNDGFLDLYHANGRVTKTAEPLTGDPYAEPNMLFAGADNGRFEPVSPQGGTLETLVATSRAAAFGDVDGDGGLDVVVVNRDAAAYLLINVVPNRGHWIRFRVLGPSGRDAIGSTVQVVFDGRTKTRGVRSAYSYNSASESVAHFGLGDATRVDQVTVLWPDGTREIFGELEADQSVTLRRGAGSQAVAGRRD
ncbi:MAG: CRTAC1 family protein [Acidobacteriota bacterium]|nr:CRTAC1 family protein [Acidobacteriota bacterium]MDH3784317.1 CRTAC1 family protein [Acidobacteriota bacterium]